MKFLTIPFFTFLLSCTFLLSSCTKHEDEAPVKELSKNQVILKSPVVSQKAYNRGLELGQRISRMERASRERESAVIKAHSMVAALERNGFKQSAQDFAKGVHAGMASNPVKTLPETEKPDNSDLKVSKYDN